MQGPALSRIIEQAQKLNACDDLFDLVKSDLALRDPYLAASRQWGFTSIHLAVFSLCLHHILPTYPPVSVLHRSAQAI